MHWATEHQRQQLLSAYLWQSMWNTPKLFDFLITHFFEVASNYVCLCDRLCSLRMIAVTIDSKYESRSLTYKLLTFWYCVVVAASGCGKCPLLWLKVRRLLLSRWKVVSPIFREQKNHQEWLVELPAIWHLWNAVQNHDLEESRVWVSTKIYSLLLLCNRKPFKELSPLKNFVFIWGLPYLVLESEDPRQCVFDNYVILRIYTSVRIYINALRSPVYVRVTESLY